MEPFYNENDEKMRLKRDDKKNGFTAATFIKWWLVPGFIGMFIIVFGKVVTGIASLALRSETITRSVNKALVSLNKDFTYLATLEWEKTNLEMLLLFGFLLGVFIKYAYSDKKAS